MANITIRETKPRVKVEKRFGSGGFMPRVYGIFNGRKHIGNIAGCGFGGWVVSSAGYHLKAFQALKDAKAWALAHKW